MTDSTKRTLSQSWECVRFRDWDVRNRTPLLRVGYGHLIVTFCREKGITPTRMLAQISRKRLGNVAATVEICNQYASLSINQSESPAHPVICRRTGTAATSFLRLGRHKNGEASRITVVPDVLTNLRFLFTKVWV